MLHTSEIIFVGDEEKDMICANDAGACAVFVNRSGEIEKFRSAANDLFACRGDRSCVIMPCMN